MLEKIIKRELLRKENPNKVICSCGKEYLGYTKVYKVKFQNREGKVLDKIVRRFHRYPEITCHCNCGAAWGRHKFSGLVSVPSEDTSEDLS